MIPWEDAHAATVAFVVSNSVEHRAASSRWLLRLGRVT
jgi:hypothetical protein